jgi:hypothetical protein
MVKSFVQSSVITHWLILTHGLEKIERSYNSNKIIMPVKIKIVPTLQKACFGCGCLGPSMYYEGDTTPWCKECFVTEEALEAVKKNMPMWQNQKKRIKCRVVPYLKFNTD